LKGTQNILSHDKKEIMEATLHFSIYEQVKNNISQHQQQIGGHFLET